MTRRSLFTAIFSSGIVAGAAQAQKQLDPDLGASLDEFSGAVRTLDVKVPNGMCPVCGTQATAFKPAEAWKRASNGKFEKTKTTYTDLVRCSKCNSAFWQDSE